MFYLKLEKLTLQIKHKPTLCSILRTIVTTDNLLNKIKYNEQTIDETSLGNLMKKYEEKIIYNSTIENARFKLGYRADNRSTNLRYEEKLRVGLQSIQPLPLTLKYFSDNSGHIEKEPETIKEKEEETVTNFPYESNISINETVNESNVNSFNKDRASLISEEVRKRYELTGNKRNWMTDYDNYENDLVDVESDEVTEENWKVNYGTPDPNSEISNFPCGGCGALLHCKDTAIPGYIPSEIYKNHQKLGGAELNAIICQRCYFLKEYNMALQVRVSPDDYPKVLTAIQRKSALVVLMVDLMDFPCSIWPGISEILGPKTPIIVVGNKVDLLPKDNSNYLAHIRQILLDNVKLSAFASTNIKYVTLISAKTGFGIENLITALQSIWRHRGDVYLVGCTNVGKSSLFNVLLQSDYCKIQATDLIQRATTSVWPGTTLNLLKFPIMRPSGYRIHMRNERLKKQQQIDGAENKYRTELLKQHNVPKFATLVGHIGQSFDKHLKLDEAKDSFSVQGSSNATGKVKMGINENSPDYVLSKWCFDTPGVVQPDQILHLLTTEELTNTLPKQLIRPETFSVKPGTSLFIAGLARLDYINGPGSIRLTVFRSNELPITICHVKDADNIYMELLGTELLKIPINSGDRLLKWPGLEATKKFTLTGKDKKLSCNDVVLSSAGWVAVNCDPDKEYSFQAWTPEKRGVFIRDCLLPKAVTLRGPKIRFSVAYGKHTFI